MERTADTESITTMKRVDKNNDITRAVKSNIRYLSLIEKVFSYPGIQQIAYTALHFRDLKNVIRCNHFLRITTINDIQNMVIIQKDFELMVQGGTIFPQLRILKVDGFNFHCLYLEETRFPRLQNVNMERIKVIGERLVVTCPSLYHFRVGSIKKSVRMKLPPSLQSLFIDDIYSIELLQELLHTLPNLVSLEVEVWNFKERNQVLDLRMHKKLKTLCLEPVGRDENKTFPHVQLFSLMSMEMISVKDVSVSVCEQSDVSSIRWLELDEVKDVQNLILSTKFPDLNYFLFITGIESRESIQYAKPIFDEAISRNTFIQPFTITSRKHATVPRIYGDLSGDIILYCNSCFGIKNLNMYEISKEVVREFYLHNVFDLKTLEISSPINDLKLFQKCTSLQKLTFQIQNSTHLNIFTDIVVKEQKHLTELVLRFDNWEMWKNNISDLINGVENLKYISLYVCENVNKMPKIQFKNHKDLKEVRICNVYTLHIHLENLSRLHTVQLQGSDV